jgi:glycosyltransferase involved in cell wall biosynthesis
MASSGSPLVSVVIPAYNGQEFIADAIRSVLAQTYDNFELTIANNCSTDRTEEIAEEFARSDARVRVYNATEHVSVVDSHNRAFTLVSEHAAYCKILGADDLLFPNCIAELVRVAEANPTVGMVSSYFLSGPYVSAGPQYPQTFLTGRDVCRLRLLHSVYAFGGPSASLLRASVIRERRPFYNRHTYHGDVDAYLEMFQEYDFGFVHQVLSYNRKGERSPTTAYLHRVNAFQAERVDEVIRFGSLYLSDKERKERLRATLHEYYMMLGYNLFEFRGHEFWDYHLNFFRNVGHSLSYSRLALYGLFRICDVVFNPLRTILNVVRRVNERIERPAPVVAHLPVKKLVAREAPRSEREVIERSPNAFHRV